MDLKQLTPKLSLNKAFLRLKPTRMQIDPFKKYLTWLLDQVNEAESEEFHKNLLADFLKNTYYAPHHFINTKGRNDLVIHGGKDAKSAVEVIIEVKRPNNRTEMLRTDNLNMKAMHELMLYYLRERVTGKNLAVKYLIATNIYEWFIFDAAVFEQAFAQDKGLVKQFMDFEAGRLSGTTTDFFYREIAQPVMVNLIREVEFTYLDLRYYEQPLRGDNKEHDKALIPLFKLFSPEHLLKLPFANDSNTLDREFYSELLHIIGLTETKDGSKKLIQRKAEHERQLGSLLENTINQLKSLRKIARLPNPQQWGESYEEQLFHVGLELVLTWINRILFLKLLEGQLLTYHEGNKNYLFLNLTLLPNFSRVTDFFFQVLARKTNERNPKIHAVFAKVPYLNSSLFEPTELEHLTLMMSNLSSDFTLPFLATTVLKDGTGKPKTGSLNTLAYLFEFLSAYDFGSEGAEEIQEGNKSLINAAVLGLIFEKINGYKDGSFFTPGYITMYMCRETIQRAVIQKFNEQKGWHCQTLDELHDKITDRREANEIINSVRICDPSVGSGHFLVSALNEIMVLKSNLKLLQDHQGRLLRDYEMEVVNDELVIFDANGEIFKYNPKNKESLRVQETIFREKQIIIENCLFGVDINSNSVNICRLRLWIELLKHAYYKADGQLETLPNIDINIKIGNSLVSRFALDADLRQVLQGSQWTIERYKTAVQTYRESTNPEEKRNMERLMRQIKNDFTTDIYGNYPKIKQLNKLMADFSTLINQKSLFAETVKEKKTREQQQKELETEINNLRAEIEAIKNNPIYANAFEWRFEFPEVLNDEGDFVGFDVVMGNPPYGVKPSLNEKHYFKNIFNTQDDIYAQFFELGLRVLKVQGLASFIAPISWLNGDNYFNTRNMIKETATLILGVILPYNVFHEAYIDTGIFSVKKGHFVEDALVYAYNIKDEVGYHELLETPFRKLNVTNWTLNHHLAIVFDPVWQQLKNKIYEQTESFNSLTTSFRGVLAPSQNYASIKRNDNFVSVFTASFERYTSPFASLEFVDYATITEGPKDLQQFAGPKLLIRRIVNRRLRIMATYTEGEFAVKKDIYVFKPHRETNIIFSLLAILNSKLISFLLTKGSSAARKDDFTQITLNDIRKIGVPFLSLEARNSFDNHVAQILTAKKHDPTADTTALEQEIDRMVYALYGLTDEEMALVETALG